MDDKVIQNIIQKELENLITWIVESMHKNNKVVSGRTIKTLRAVTNIDNGSVVGKLFGSSVFEQLEFGRGKSNKGTKGQRTWEDDLRYWMRLRGIDQSAFYPIWRKINEKGYKGVKGLITDPIDRFKANVSKQLRIQIVKDLKNNGINGNQ